VATLAAHTVRRRQTRKTGYVFTAQGVDAAPTNTNGAYPEKRWATAFQLTVFHHAFR
jgi:hypothetical protein